MWLTGFDAPACTRSTSTSRCATTACCRRSRASTACSGTSRAASSSTTSGSARTCARAARLRARGRRGRRRSRSPRRSKRLWEKYEVSARFFLDGLPPGRARPRPDGACDAASATRYAAIVDGRGDDASAFLDEQAALAKLVRARTRTQPPRDRAARRDRLLRRLAAEVRKITAARGAGRARDAEQAVRQFFSEGLAAGEIVDVFGLADDERPEISILSDEFLDDLDGDAAPNRRCSSPAEEAPRRRDPRARGGATRCRRSCSARSSRRCCALRTRQITSAEVVERLVEMAKRLREARHRHEELGLSEEEAAFYDALAGSAEDSRPTPRSPRSPASSSRASRATCRSTGPTTKAARPRSASRSSGCFASTSTGRRHPRTGEALVAG